MQNVPPPQIAVNRIVLLTDVEAADVLGLSASTLRRWRCEDRGQGPRWIKNGGRVQYDVRDLETYLEECKRGGSRRVV